MHETLHTYRFWVWRKKHLPFFSCFVKNIQTSWKNFPKVYFEDEDCVSLWLWFSLFRIILSKINIVSPSWDHDFHSFKSYFRRSILCPLLGTTIFTLSNHTSEDQYCVPFLGHMQHDVWCLCYAKWCNDVMLRRWHSFRKIHIYPHTIFLYQHWFFAVSSAFP
jgi:hypothetical protein